MNIVDLYFSSNGKIEWHCCDNREEKNGICIGEASIDIRAWVLLSNPFRFQIST